MVIAELMKLVYLVFRVAPSKSRPALKSPVSCVFEMRVHLH